MSKLIDLTGKRFGMLYVERRIGSDKNNQPLWLCKCDCGNEKELCGQALRKGRNISCGCYGKSLNKNGQRNLKHGMFGTRIYRSWASMIQRCENPNDHKYKNYGGRGISVCEEWHSFESFYKWAVNNGYSDELSIDRIDVNGNYMPDNCRWADIVTQENNRTNNRLFEIDGTIHTMSEWARIYGLKPSTVFNRLRYGMSEYDAITTPYKGRN